MEPTIYLTRDSGQARCGREHRSFTSFTQNYNYRLLAGRIQIGLRVVLYCLINNSFRLSKPQKFCTISPLCPNSDCVPGTVRMQFTWGAAHYEQQSTVICIRIQLIELQNKGIIIYHSNESINSSIRQCSDTCM